MPERPRAIVYSERLFFASIALNVLLLILNRDVLAQNPSLMLINGVTLAIFLALVLATTRLRNTITKWILTVSTAGGLAVSLVQIGFSDFSSLLQTLIASFPQAAAVGMLFTRDAASWFKSDGTAQATEGPSTD